MNDYNKMRLQVLKEIKQIIRFFQAMENGVKTRQPSKIFPAYVYLTSLAYHMVEGDLSPLSIELKQELLHHEYMREVDDK